MRYVISPSELASKPTFLVRGRLDALPLFVGFPRSLSRSLGMTAKMKTDYSPPHLPHPVQPLQIGFIPQVWHFSRKYGL